ncbi:hypothetical protein [Rhizobium straminoryzae]|uniref:hypothetical protein n=1 Tax=Rhizobium straminoryzae TaxID=1387186 RepID=UPI00163DD60C|nr:hypothetical protein [Rhizobium straminoryzae]
MATPIDFRAHVDTPAARKARATYRQDRVEPTSGVPFAITHAPGCISITDIPDSAYHA